MAAKRRGSGGGAGIEWHPTSHDEVRKQVEAVRAKTGQVGQYLAIYLPQMIRQKQMMMGPDAGLTCPAPPTDPDGEYRVGLDGNGEPEIQRRDADTGAWGAAPAILGAVERRRQHLRDALDALQEVLMAGDVPEHARTRVQLAHDRITEALKR
ncbi:MAG: hypothetical protein K8H88_06105 [Sandaracinaceae bacterium]|nr:hypothetical protein [Sandaracinaceae bacterium]